MKEIGILRKQVIRLQRESAALRAEIERRSESAEEIAAGRTARVMDTLRALVAVFDEAPRSPAIDELVQREAVLALAHARRILQ